MDEIEILKQLSRTMEKMAQMVDPPVNNAHDDDPDPAPELPKRPQEFHKDAELQECKHKTRTGKLCGTKSFAPYCKKHIHMKCHADEVKALGIESNYEHIKQKNREYQKKFQERKKKAPLADLPAPAPPQVIETPVEQVPEDEDNIE